MTEGPVPLLLSRGRTYLLLGLTGACLAVALILIALLQRLPFAAHNTAFANVDMGVAPHYWSSVGLGTGEMDDGAARALSVTRLDIFNNNLRTPLWLAGLALLIFRRFRLLFAIALLLYLSYGLTDRLNTRFPSDAEPINRITQAMRTQANTDAAVDLGAAPAVRRRLCDFTMEVFFDPGHDRRECHPQMAQVTMRYVLMQIAYLENDPATARRQFDAMKPGQNLVMNTMSWRILVVRDWLNARGYPPSATSFEPVYVGHVQMEPGQARIVGWLAAILGSCLVVVAAVLLVLSVQVQRRTRRVALMILDAA